jgi:hypothetical protein
MEQVKGVSYSLGELTIRIQKKKKKKNFELIEFKFFFFFFEGEFLGPAYWRNGPEVQPAGQTELEYEKSLLVNKENDLFHCVIYLAPGIFQLKFYLVIQIPHHSQSLNRVNNSVTHNYYRRLSLLPFTGGLDSQL